MAEKDEVRDEYHREDLGTGTRGKFYDACKKEKNVVLLDPDLVKSFPDSDSVNKALREYLRQRSGDPRL
jgi:hypothetical protein